MTNRKELVIKIANLLCTIPDEVITRMTQIWGSTDAITLWTYVDKYENLSNENNKEELAIKIANLLCIVPDKVITQMVQIWSSTNIIALWTYVDKYENLNKERKKMLNLQQLYLISWALRAAYERSKEEWNGYYIKTNIYNTSDIFKYQIDLDQFFGKNQFEIKESETRLLLIRAITLDYSFDGPFEKEISLIN